MLTVSISVLGPASPSLPEPPPVKNLQVGDNDLIGNRFNGHDLSRYLRHRGIDSSHLVHTKRSDDPHTHLIDEDFANHPEFDAALREFERLYDTHSLHSPLAFSLLSNPLFLDADVVHYHLIHNASFNLNLLPTLTSLKPSVWTIHDAWAYTGHCIQPLGCERWKTGCGECPHLDTPFSLTTDTSALNWELKRDIMQRCELDLIVASQHMLHQVQQSPILSHLPTHLVPFGLDLAAFSPTDPAPARARLGIPPENVVLCFRADSSPFKGLPLVKQALQQLTSTKRVTLLTVAQKGLVHDLAKSFHTVEAGWLTDDRQMLDVYHAADVFLMPSVAEAFGMMAMEAMACGKPVIACEGTSLPEVLAAPEGGMVVPQGDAGALKEAIERLVASPEQRRQLGARARQIAEQRYDKDRYVSRLIAVYEEVIAKRKPTARTDYLLSEQRKTVGNRRHLPARVANRMTASLPAVAAGHRRFKGSRQHAFYTRVRQRPGLKLPAVLIVRPLAYLAWLLRGRT
jgi:glycosyltransferase involved in cell wall biosynthesis